MFNRIQKFSLFNKVIFTLLIGLSVVSFWRGVWGIMDIYLFPENAVMSSWSSILIGISILYVTHHLTKELT